MYTKLKVGIIQLTYKKIGGQAMRPVKYRKDKTTSFVSKLYQMLTSQDSSHIINWTEQQNAFIIHDLSQFAQMVLPKYFKHSNYNSFVRQLNMYNFNKIRYTSQGLEFEHVYQHPLFSKLNENKLNLIRRRETPNRCQSLMLYNNKNSKKQQQQNNEQDYVYDLKTKIKEVKQKQQMLQQFCLKLIRQNQILISQNQELSHKIKKQSKKKQRILEQVFRIIGVSITEFWEQFCDDTQTIEQKTNNFQQIYTLLMNFIHQNDLIQIFKILEFFISPNQKSEKKKKLKTFKVINPNQQPHFLDSYTDQQIQEFINSTNIILKQKSNKKSNQQK